MSEMDLIKNSLDLNPYLTNDIKSKLYSLISELKKKIKEVNLNRLSELLKTLRIAKLGKFERKGLYFYDVFKNVAYINADKAKGNIDIDNIFMKFLLEMATSTGKFTGFNSDQRLRALNLAYTEILATYVIGNEGDSDLEEEVFIANLLSHIVGKDTMFNSYFNNDGTIIIKTILDAERGIEW